MADGNGAVSYQKASSSSPNGSSSSSPPSKMKWVIGAVLVVILGVTYTILGPHGPSSDVVDKAVAKSGLTIKADGKIKLFDAFSEYLFLPNRILDESSLSTL